MWTGLIGNWKRMSEVEVQAALTSVPDEMSKDLKVLQNVRLKSTASSSATATTFTIFH